MSESGKPEKNGALSVADGGTAGPGGDDNALVKIDSPGGRKLIRTLVDGLGAVAGPALRARMEAGRIRKIAEAKAEAIRTLAAAEKEVIEMLGSERGRQIVASVENMTAAPAVRERADERLFFQEVKRQNNIEAVAWQTVQKVPEQVSDEPVHPDWTARFFESIKDVSDETMQSLWSSVLAGEVESPGRTSLRTLDVLKNLSRDDAKEFERLAQFVIRIPSSVFYPYTVTEAGAEIAERVLPYGKKIHLQECGLIYHEPNLVSKLRLREQGSQLLCGGFLFMLFPDSQSRTDKMEFPMIRLTGAGMQIARLIPEKFPEFWYIRALAKYASDRYGAVLRVISPMPGPVIFSMSGDEGKIRPTASDEELRALLENCSRRVVVK